MSSVSSGRLVSEKELASHAKDWTAIHGVVYDISSFLPHHPGGSVIKISGGRDGTCLFESYHPGDSSTQARVQATLKNKCKVIGKLENYQATDNKFFTTVRDRVEAHLKKKSLDRHYIQPIVVGEAILTISAYFVLSYLVATTGNYLIAAALGVLVGRLGFLMHTGNHCGASGTVLINRFIGYFMDMVGSSNLIWQYEHQVAHHCDPNEMGKDNDCEIGNPFIRFHPHLKHHYFQQFQHITVPLAITIGFIKWCISDWFHFARGHVGHVTFERSAMDWAKLCFFKTTWFYLHIVMPYQAFGAAHTVGLTLVTLGVGAHYLENVFIVNHIQHGLVPPAVSHWANRQVLATTNWASGSKFWNFFSGGLNHQVEHHLFPSVSTWLYPEISPIVKQTCKEFNLPYFDYPNFVVAWIDMFRYIKALGQKDFDVKTFRSKLTSKML